LQMLYEARNSGELRDSFNTTGAAHCGWYQSAAEAEFSPPGFGWAQRFSDGLQWYAHESAAGSMRCVRG
jgi:hypothetical protein